VRNSLIKLINNLENEFQLYNLEMPNALKEEALTLLITHLLKKFGDDFSKSKLHKIKNINSLLGFFYFIGN